MSDHIFNYYWLLIVSILAIITGVMFFYSLFRYVQCRWMIRKYGEDGFKKASYILLRTRSRDSVEQIAKRIRKYYQSPSRFIFSVVAYMCIFSPVVAVTIILSLTVFLRIIGISEIAIKPLYRIVVFIISLPIPIVGFALLLINATYTCLWKYTSKDIDAAEL